MNETTDETPWDYRPIPKKPRKPRPPYDEKADWKERLASDAGKYAEAMNKAWPLPSEV